MKKKLYFYGIITITNLIYVSCIDKFIEYFNKLILLFNGMNYE
jgi:hypothetical protein